MNRDNSNYLWRRYLLLEQLVTSPHGLAHFYWTTLLGKERDARTSADLRSFYQNTALFFSEEEEFARHRKLAVGWMDCMVLLDTELILAPTWESKQLAADCLRLEMDDSFDFFEYANNYGSISDVAMEGLITVGNSAHARLERAGL